MIHCIWYPSGGFGYYVNLILSQYGDNFVRPTNAHLFSDKGDSHCQDLILPLCINNNWHYNLSTIDTKKNYSVLIDNGINNESEDFVQHFKNSKVIKICYSDWSWPIIAKTSIVKAFHDTLENNLSLGQQWPSNENWAVREKYFLYLRDHPLRHRWRPAMKYYSLDVGTLLDYTKFKQELGRLEVVCSDFANIHNTMLEKNCQYFSSVLNSKNIISALKNNQSIDISHITDLWDQAVVNYFIQLEFGIEVPANTYANWFVNTREILHLLP